MSSFFEVPQQLILIFTLAVSGSGDTTGFVTKPSFSATRPAMSAEDPLHFADQTWLSAIKEGAGGEELARYAGRIFQTSSGRYYVPSEADRNLILNMRRDEDIARLIALDLARRNARKLQSRLGRPAKIADLYLAHSLGSDSAIRLIQSVERNPNAEVAALLPDLGERVPEILFHEGRPSRLHEVMHRLERELAPKRGAVSIAASHTKRASKFAGNGLKGATVDRTVTALHQVRELADAGWTAEIVPAR